jgi:hypothetical protein
MIDDHFKAERVSRTATIMLNGEIESVFPLFSAIEEKKWADGWNPAILYPASERLEAGMVFLTEGNHQTENEYAWIVSDYQTDKYLVEYIVSTSNRIWVITIRCAALSAFGTEATVTYTFTGLNQLGNELNRNHIERMFARDLADWEQAINHYLKTGHLLKNQ